MPKTNLEKLGSIENFKFDSLLTADEPDMDRLRKYVFGILTDKARAQDARDAAKAETESVREELNTTKAELASKGDPDLAAKLAKAEADLKKAQDDLTELNTRNLAIEVAEQNGLSRAQAKYLTGTTEDELAASAEQFIKDNGIQPKDPDQDPDNDDLSLHRTPRSTINPLDPNPTVRTQSEPDPYEVVAGFDNNPFR